MIGDLALVAVDIVVVVVVSIGVGAWAPRWPAAWLSRDTFPLYLWPWETVPFYRGLGVTWLARRLPERGGTFGGDSKSRLPGTSAREMEGYLREVRRAEWVHWWSIASSLVLALFNPWWLALAFILLVTAGNLPFIVVLRNNRLRLRRIIDRDGRRT